MTVKIKVRIPNDWTTSTLNEPIYLFADTYVETEEFLEVFVKMLYLPGYLASMIRPERWVAIYKLIDQIAIDKYCELRENGYEYEKQYSDL